MTGAPMTDADTIFAKLFVADRRWQAAKTPNNSHDYLLRHDRPDEKEDFNRFVSLVETHTQTRIIGILEKDQTSTYLAPSGDAYAITRRIEPARGDVAVVKRRRPQDRKVVPATPCTDARRNVAPTAANLPPCPGLLE